ncbi:MAG: hypothetical protein ACKVOW_03300, partial [Chitinophagaceae bacterium]
TILRLRTISATLNDRTLLRFTTSTANSNNGFNSSFVGNERQAAGTALVFGTAGSNFSAAFEKMRLNETGFLGIGTATPLARVHIDLSNIATTSTAMIINDDDDPIVLFQRNNLNKGFIQQLGDDFKIGTTIDNNSGNLIVRTNGADRAWFTSNGRLGIGTSNPLSQVHMTGELTLQNSNPVIQMKNATGDDKAFIQTISNDMLIGTNNINTTGNFIVRTNGANRLTVTPQGFVGIGITPTVPLHVEGGNWPTAMAINSASSSYLLEFRRDNVSKGFIRVFTDDLKMGTNGENNNGRFIFSTREDNRLIINPTGPIGINTFYDNADFELAVKGNIICEDITTASFALWPDYVFNKTYKLKPLNQVEKFIQKNHHLPNIPSAKEIEQKGIQLGDMQKRMMEKIEELTLYIIELNKKSELLQKELQKLKEHKK